MRNCLFLLLLTTSGLSSLRAQNPLILDQFTADPTARVFGDSLYIYPSHDIPWAPGKGRRNWFVMEDYHVFSTADLIHYTDHGVIISQDRVPWVDSTSYSMWAPDCVLRNSRYYFYFPTRPADMLRHGKGFTVGVAIAEHPGGPFIPQDAPISNVHGIDPNVFIDKDGRAYLYWAEGEIFVARLKPSLLELGSDPKIVGALPKKGLKEGPFVFERNGVYYLTYPHVQDKTEQLEYAVSDNPMGPFRYAGVLMDEWPDGCWTNHQSIVSFKGQWYLFYHHNDLSPDFDKNRSIRADSLFFNNDGTIRKVIPTLRGVGVSPAGEPIQLDRYTRISPQGASIAFLDPADRFKGWQLLLDDAGAWVQYNSVDFGTKRLGDIHVRASSQSGATLEVRVDRLDGPVIGRVILPGREGWGMFQGALRRFPPGIHHLFVICRSGAARIDWLQFTAAGHHFI